MSEDSQYNCHILLNFLSKNNFKTFSASLLVYFVLINVKEVLFIVHFNGNKMQIICDYHDDNLCFVEPLKNYVDKNTILFPWLSEIFHCICSALN